MGSKKEKKEHDESEVTWPQIDTTGKWIWQHTNWRRGRWTRNGLNGGECETKWNWNRFTPVVSEHLWILIYSLHRWKTRLTDNIKTRLRRWVRNTSGGFITWRLEEYTKQRDDCIFRRIVKLIKKIALRWTNRRIKGQRKEVSKKHCSDKNAFNKGGYAVNGKARIW